jgi:hypothetical protein
MMVPFEDPEQTAPRGTALETAMIPTTWLLICMLPLSTPGGNAISRLPSAVQPLAPAASGYGLEVAIDDTVRQQYRAADHFVIENFPLEQGVAVDLAVRHAAVLSRGARIVVNDGQTEREIPAPDATFLIGTVDNVDASSVVLALSPTRCQGYIRLAGRLYVLSSGPLDAALTPVIYELTTLPDGVIEWAPFECGVDKLDQPEATTTYDPNAGGIAQTCGRRIQMAVETDWELYANVFNQVYNEEAAYLLLLWTAMTDIYSRDVDTVFEISYMRIWTTPDDPWTATDAGAQLEQFRNYWRANMNHVPRQLAHFCAARGLGGGVAWLPGLCNGWGYAVSSGIGGWFPYPLVNNHRNNWDPFVVAHETGHNCGAPHTHDMDPQVDNCAGGDCISNGTIMSYCHTCSGGMRNIMLEFAQRNIDENLHPTIFGAACVPADSPIEITQQPNSQDACAGDTVVLTVAATGDTNLTYQWLKNGFELSGETSDTLVLAAIEDSDAGGYSVAISGDANCPTVSDVATVTVSDPAEITTQPVDMTVCDDSPAAFVVVAFGAQPTYQWRHNGANIAGATQSAYIIDSVELADVGVYDVLVTTGGCTITSEPATLALQDPCDINCDGAINAIDIEPFVDLLLQGTSGCAPCVGDINRDGAVNSLDIDGFIECLIGG